MKLTYLAIGAAAALALGACSDKRSAEVIK